MGSIISNAQYYVSGIAPEEIDQINIDFKELKLRYEFDKAKEKLDSLSQYWTVEFSSDTRTIPQWQNFYYCKIQAIYKRFYSDKTNELLLDELLGIKDDLKSALPHDNVIWGLYYSKLASLFRSTRDYKRSRAYYLKAIKNLEIDSTRIVDKLKTQSWLAALELKVGNNEKALEIYSFVIKEQEDMQTVDSIDLAYTYYNMSRYYERTTDYESHAIYLNKSSKIILNHFGEENKFYWFIQIAIGFNLYNRGNYKKALEVFNFLDTKYSNTQSETAKIANNKKWIANCYRKLNQLEKAKEIYKEIIFYYRSDNKFSGLTSAYNELSLVTHSNEEKINLLNKALSACDKDDYCDPRNQAIIYKNLAIEYRKSGDVLKGLNYLNRALELENVNKDKYAMYQSYTYNSLSLIYDELDNTEKAKDYAIKALEAHQVESKSNYERKAFLQSNLAYFLIKTNELDKAQEILDYAVQNLNRSATNTYDNKAGVFKQKVYLYKENKEYRKAFELNQKCLEAYANSKGKRSDDYSRCLINKADLFRLLENTDSCRAILKQAYEHVGLNDLEKTVDAVSKIPRAYLWLAFKTLNNNMKVEVELDSLQPIFDLRAKVEMGCSLIDRMRESHYFESSEQNFIEVSSSFLDRAIDLLYYLNQRNPDEKTLVLIFKCIEKSKSISINRIFERSQSIMEKGVPLEVIKKEKQIISDFEQSFKKYSDFIANGEDEKATSESVAMFELQSQKDEFLNNLQTNYPDYYNRRYAQNLISIVNLQEIAVEQNRAFLQYHWTGKDLYKLYVGPNNSKISKLHKEEIVPSLDSLNATIVSAKVNSDENYFSQNQSSFIKNSTEVYDKLIGYDLDSILPFNLTIIPDGLLNGLSFDVLIKNKPEENISYSTLPYLIKDHSISYVGSASQFARLQNFKMYKGSSNYIGFAPSYSGDDSQGRNIGSSNLLHNDQEVKLSSAYFNGDEYIGANATEARFKDLVSNYNIAHLALHGIVNDTFPLNSYLQFVETDSINDGRLYVHEISEMEINNNLMVLSACQTNTGEEIKGEGLLGISRAFQIASCPNILVSNWLVDDKSASQLMQPFFKGISEGRSPADALREAKLQFINSSSEVNAHPTYWAAFSYHGNPNYTLQRTKSTAKFWIFILAGFFGLLFLFRFFKKV